MGTSKASATWEGPIKTGKGAMTPAHAADIPFSLGTRFAGERGSNPEEVIGAALAGCFSMALSLGLEKAGHPPRSIRTSASVHLNRDGDGFKIDKIELTTRASVPGLDADRFTAIAEATKKACPVSKALAGVDSITLQASLEPESAA
jgi:osmotically inducible protein OsmC